LPVIQLIQPLNCAERLIRELVEAKRGRLYSLSAGDGAPKRHSSLLVRVAHEWRTAAAGPADIEDTRRLVLLSAMALVGDAVFGEGLVESFQLGEGKQGRRAFRAWLAEFLLKQPSQPG
jgi:hypothetical protein